MSLLSELLPPTCRREFIQLPYKLDLRHILVPESVVPPSSIERAVNEDHTQVGGTLAF